MLCLKLLIQFLMFSFGSTKADKVLITGGAGFIGYHVADKLRESNIPVIILDNFNEDYDINLKRARASKLKQNGAIIHEGSARDSCIINYIIKHYTNTTGIVHCAAFTSIDGNINNPIRSVEDNIEPLVAILDVLSKHKEVSANLVYMSSSNVYSKDTMLPYSTANPSLHPKHMFSAMKLSGESLVDGYSTEYGINSIGLRLFTVYGPWSRPGIMIYDFAKSIADNKPIEIPHQGNIPISRDFIYIDDVVEAILLALKYSFTNKQHHVIFNVASGISTPVTTVIDMLQSFMAIKIFTQIKVPLSSANALNVCADISNTTFQLKLVLKVGLNTGIKNFVKWFQKYSKFNGSQNNERFDNFISHISFEEYISDKNEAFRKRVGDLREKYTAYAEGHNIPVAKFYRKKEFIYFKGVDAGGTRHTLNDHSVAQMKEMCTMIDECVAFNLRGDLKSILPPHSEWYSGVGLYVADIDVCKAGLHTCFGNSTCKYLGPAQFECGCHEGYGLVGGATCVELYREGRFSQTEADEKLADYIDGKDWKKYIGHNSGRYIQILDKDEYLMNGHLLYYPEAKGDVVRLKDACTKTYRCIGFSTNGVLKKAIDQPKNWFPSHNSLYLLDIDYCSLDPFRCKPTTHCHREGPGYWSC